MQFQDLLDHKFIEFNSKTYYIINPSQYSITKRRGVRVKLGCQERRSGMRQMSHQWTISLDLSSPPPSLCFFPLLLLCEPYCVDQDDPFLIPWFWVILLSFRICDWRGGGMLVLLALQRRSVCWHQIQVSYWFSFVSLPVTVLVRGLFPTVNSE